MTNEDETNSNESSMALSKLDRAFLSKYLNSTYLADEAMQEITKQFEQDSSVQLKNFLSLEWEDRIRYFTASQDQTVNTKVGATESYQVGVNEEWKLIGPAHQQRFLEYIPDAATDQILPSAGNAMLELKTNLFQSGAFARYLSLLTSLGTPLGHRGHIRRFRRGLDYTVAHYGILTKTSVLDATLCFCADRAAEQNEADKDIEALWAYGDVGGFECYVSADDEDAAVAADEYNEEDDTELLSVAPSNNTLSLVYRDPGTMRFIKYVSATAPSSRWDISMEYKVEPNEGAEEEDVEEEEEEDEQESGIILDE
jgi:hypothetical protein